MPDRTATDYALEHAEYLARAAERFINVCNDADMAAMEAENLTGDESEGEVEAVDEKVYQAREACTEAIQDLRGCIHGFRTRRDRAAKASQHDPAMAAPGQAAAQASHRVLMLNPQDLQDLRRLANLFADGEGWNLPKARMQRLAQLGVVRHVGGARYSITSFGMWAVGDWGRLPLETVEEAGERSRKEMEARNG